MPANNRQGSLGPKPTVRAGSARATGEGHRAGTGSATAAGDAGKGRANERSYQTGRGAAAAQRPLGLRRTTAPSAPGLPELRAAAPPPNPAAAPHARERAGEAASRDRPVPSRSLGRSRALPGPHRVDAAVEIHARSQGPPHRSVWPVLHLTPTSREGSTASVPCKEQCREGPVATFYAVCRLDNSLSWRTGRHPLGQIQAG